MTERLTYENVCNKFGEFLKSVHNDINKDRATLVKDDWLTSSLFSGTVGHEDELDTEVVLMELFIDYLTARQIMWERDIVHLIIQAALKNSHYGVKATVLDVANGIKQHYADQRNAYCEFEGDA